MGEYVTLIIDYLSGFIETSAAIIIGVASIQAIGFYLIGFIKRTHLTKEDIRLRLGRSLAVALELLLGADI